MMHGTARLLGDHEVEVDTAEGTRSVSRRRRADRHRLAAAHPRLVPARRRADPDDPRVLPADDLPGEHHGHRLGRHRRRVRPHVHVASASKVTLVVSRQQVLPQKDPEVAAVLEDDFLKRGVKLLKGARAIAIERDGDAVVVRCDDGRVVHSSHAVLAIGSMPNTDGLGLDAAGVEVDDGGYVTDQPPLPDQRRRTSTPPATSAASCRCRRWRRCRAARSPST